MALVSDMQSIEQRFRLDSLVGRGAFGEVHRGIDRATSLPIAVKRLVGDLDDPLTLERFEREARLLARVESPHVVRYVAHGRDASGRACLVLEWLEGEDLAHRQRREPMPGAAAVEVVRQAALGLDALHDAGIVHRDIKPSNFFLVGPPDGLLHVKLIDLGIARAFADRPLTLEGARIGTPLYMSPEQARGDDLVAAPSDVFSLGVVLYELLAGRRPFGGNDPFAVLARIVLEEPPRLGALVDVPAELDAIVMRAMAKNPAHRFETARAMADALASAPRPTWTTPRGRDDPPTVQLRSGAQVRALERRVVTALFAGFGGLDDADGAMDAFASSVGRHGGEAHRTLGRRMIGVFGAAQSTGDEPVRAARAALEIASHAPGTRLAIATGRAFAGAGGLSGEAIERGAAVMERARGSIRLDDATARWVESDFAVAGLPGSFALEGERAQAPAGDASLSGRATPTVGRDRELETLHDALDRVVTSRRPGVVLVLGPPGIGKSRLRAEWLRRSSASATGMPPRVLAVRADPMLSATPLGMLARALRTKAGVAHGATLDAQRESVRTWARALGIEPRAGLLGELLRVDFESARDGALAAARQDPQLLRSRLHEVFADVLDALSRTRPVIVTLEDLHAADGATLDAIGWALDSLPGSPLLVAGFGRLDAGRRLAGLASASPIELHLGPLSTRASEQLVLAVLGPGTVPSQVGSLTERAAGNPLFLEELLRAHGSGNELPLAVQAAMQIRLDALAPMAKRVALVGSVLGTSVWREALVQLAHGVEVDSALAALVHAEVLAERPRARAGRSREFVYRSGLLRDAAYEMLAPDEVQGLHRIAASWLSQSGEDDHAVLAHHLERAGEHNEAATHYLIAARRAARESAYEAALAHAERGLSLVDDANEIAAALGLLAAQACHPLGRYADALAHGERALELTREPPRQLEIAAARGLSLRRTGAVDRAHATLVATLAVTQSAPPSAETLRARMAARVELAWCDQAAGRHAEAIATATQALASLPAEVQGVDALVLSAMHALAMAQYGAGDLERSLATHRATVDRASALAHRWRGEGARHGLGQVLLALGRNDEAKRELEAARDHARTYRLPSTEGYALHLLGIVRARQGDVLRARADQTRAAAIGRSLVAPALESGAQVMLARLALDAGDEARADEHAIAALAVAQVPSTWRAAATAVRALVAARRGDANTAAGHVAAARALLDEDARSRGRAESFAVVTLVATLDAMGARDEADALAGGARTMLEAWLARVGDEDLRRSMRDDVPEHRALLAARDA